LLVTATAEVVDTSEMIGPVKVAVELAAWIPGSTDEKVELAADELVWTAM
jgi:hypothetical protein